MEWNSFYSNACYECGNWGEGYPLIYCKNCGVVGFCEKDSKVDNPRHKELCKVLTELRGTSSALFTSDGWGQKTWTLVKTELMLVAQVLLKRKLTKQEQEIFKFPKRCVSCYEVDLDKLTDCKICPSTSFCSKHLQSKEEHQDRCKKLIECAASDVFFSPMLRQDIPKIPQDKKNPKLPEDMSQFIKSCGPNIVPFPHNVQTSASSEVFTRPLSLLYGIEKFNYDVKDKLIVHIVGSNAMDLEDPSTFEIVLHFRPNLREIMLIFVGPDLKGIDVPSMTPYLCKDCQNNGVELGVKIVPMVYHDYYKEKEFLKPDLVIGYNIGVSEYSELDSWRDTWSKTIETLGGLNCPFIVTCYTEDEARKDRERILERSGNLEVFFEGKNPFGSLRHYRDFETEEFYYQNQFIMGFKRKGEEEMVYNLRGLTLDAYAGKRASAVNEKDFTF